MLFTVDINITWFYPCNAMMNQEMSLYRLHSQNIKCQYIVSSGL